MQRMRIQTALLFFLIATAVSAADHRDRVAVIEDNGIYRFSIGEQEVTSYDTRSKWAKPFFWPVRTRSGVGVTRDWPIDPKFVATRDHVHQKSAWLTYGEVSQIEGIGGLKSRPIDFWAETPGHGVIAVTQQSMPREGDALRTTNEWRSANGKPVLLEERTIRVVPAEAGYLILIESDFNAKFGPVVFDDTKEGAIGVRVHDDLCVGEKGWFNPKSGITNANGLRGETTCWGFQSDWCDYSGELNGKKVGIAIFDDSANKYRSCWHVRNYGLMAANPFGRAKSGFPAMRGRTDLVKLAQDEHLQLRYAIYVHDGDAVSGKVAEAFKQFAHPKR